jgi:hypothetical protein
VRADSKALFAPPGWLFYVLEGTLYAQRFDVESAEVRGNALQLASDIHSDERTGRSAFSVSSNGVLVYRRGKADPEGALALMDHAGVEIAVPRSLKLYKDLTLNGREVIAVVSEGSRKTDLWRINLDTGTGRNLTKDRGVNGFPVVSPDGQELAFQSNRNGPPSIFHRPLNEAGEDRMWEGVLCNDGRDPAPSDWTKGWFIYMCRRGQESDLWATSIDASSVPKRYLPAARNGRLSPDQQWMVYQSAVDDGIYVNSFPEARQPIPVSGERGLDPHWHSEGAQITYLKPGRLEPVMAVSVKRTQAGVPVPGQPQALRWEAGNGSPIAIFPDLRQAVVTKVVGGDQKLNVYPNWLLLPRTNN